MTRPLQPITPEANPSFEANRIVLFLLDSGPYDMNRLAMMEFSDEDRQQFAQLIGYSLHGYEELSYVDNENWGRVLDARKNSMKVR